MPPRKAAKAAAAATTSDPPRASRTAKENKDTAASTRPKRSATTVEEEPPKKKSKISTNMNKSAKGTSKGATAKAEASTTVAEVPPDSAVPKRRGRPRDPPVPFIDDIKDEARDEPATDQLKNEPQGESAVSTKRKQRGTAAKAKAEEPQKANETTLKRGRGQKAKESDKVATTTAEAIKAEELAPKRGRGRAAKTTETVEEPTIDVEPTPKQGRGRNSKASKVEALPEPVSKKRGRLAKVEPETKEEVAEQPSKKRRGPQSTAPSEPKEETKAAQKSEKSTKKPARKGALAKSPVVAGPVIETSVQTKASTTTADDSGPSYWLMKAEPEPRFENGHDVSFSIDTLASRTEPEPWDGVRNPVATKNMKTMKKGELAFFYHSNCKVPGIAGLMEIVEEAQVDESAFDKSHYKHDERSNPDKPRWYCVKVAFREKFKKFVPLKELQRYAKEGGVLSNMQVLRQTRLSVSRVTKTEWEFIMTQLVSNEEEPAPYTETATKTKARPSASDATEKKRNKKEVKVAPAGKARGGRKPKPAPETEATTGAEEAVESIEKQPIAAEVEAAAASPQQDPTCQSNEQDDEILTGNTHPEPVFHAEQTSEPLPADETHHTILPTAERESAISSKNVPVVEANEPTDASVEQDKAKQPPAPASPQRTASRQPSVARSTRATSRQRSVPPTPSNPATTRPDSRGLAPSSAVQPGSRGKSAQPPSRPISRDETRARSAQPDIISRPGTANTSTKDVQGLSEVAETNEAEHDSTFDGIGESFNF